MRKNTEKVSKLVLERATIRQLGSLELTKVPGGLVFTAGGVHGQECDCPKVSIRIEI